jgi:glucosamine--fructose-6-phosphate aminotransferase (isomerizing)
VLELEGSYAILVISNREPDKIIGARRESPLVIGLSTTGNYIASDALSFHGITNKVLLVEDRECVVLTREKVIIYDALGNEVSRAPLLTDWYHRELT